MEFSLVQEMHELATLLAGAADSAFVSQAVALQLQGSLPLLSLSVAFPVPYQSQQLLVSMGDLCSPGYKSLQVLEPDKTSLGYGQGLHRRALGQPEQQPPPASHFVAEQVPAETSLDQAAVSTVLAAELSPESEALLGDARERFRLLAAALGTCLASQASSVPLAAAAFLGWSPHSHPKVDVRGTCNRVLPEADRDDSPSAGLAVLEHTGQQPAGRQSLEATRQSLVSAAQKDSLSAQLVKPSADPAPAEQASLQLGPAHNSQHQPPNARATAAGSASCAEQDAAEPQVNLGSSSSSSRKRKGPDAARTTAQHPFWLTFDDQKLEQSFTRSFGEQLLVIEPMYHVPMLWGMHILAFTHSFSLEPEPCFGLQRPLSGALLFFSVLAWGLRLFDRSLYLQHRELCISLVRFLVGLLFAFSITPFVLAHPLVLDSKMWWRDVSSCTMPLYLAMSPLLLMIRFRTFLPAQLAVLCMFASNVPAVTDKYMADMRPAAAYVMFGTLYLVMGLVLPIFAMRKFELSSRKAFLFRHNVALSAA